MSFCQNIKTEAEEIIPIAKHCRIAEVVAFDMFATKKSVDKIYCSVIKSLTDSLNEKDLRKISLAPQMGLKEFSEAFIGKTCCKRSFLRGAFLACGLMNDPEKGYRLEFSSEERSNLDIISEALSEFDISGGISVRKGRFVLFFSEAERISDILNIIETHKSLMDFENARILRDYRNLINRQVNCETSNLKKTALASEKQITAIDLLLENGLLDKDMDDLKEIADLRKEHPEMSLADLGKLCSPPIGRSGVNHRMDKILRLYEEFKEKKGKREEIS